QLEQGLRDATLGRRLFPLVCASGVRVIGLQPLLDALVRYVPSPVDRPFVVTGPDGSDAQVAPSATSPHAAVVWKTLADPFAGRITMLRIIAGTFTSDTTVHNVTRDVPERLGHLLALQG